MSDDPEARVRAAIADDRAVTPADAAAILRELDATRATAAERWRAIGALAPAAKARRGQAQDLARLARRAATALAAIDPALATELVAAAELALPEPATSAASE
ncbi:MAG: hypothetical protein R2939_15010 [Kofleriaceae bacterium]